MSSGATSPTSVKFDNPMGICHGAPIACLTHPQEVIMAYSAKGRTKDFPVFDCDSHIYEPPEV